VKWLMDLLLSIPGRFVPFFSWLPNLTNVTTLKADIIAGATVAMVLVPQSMAYASLAGLPAYYGLYASFLPPMVAALFGSSRQLATGPVAMVSLMTATALEPLATVNPDGFLLYALTLAVMVGVIQLSLGLLKLGVLVDLLSHPVVVGFTNAGAIIIATSQLNKIFGVGKSSTGADGEALHHYEVVGNIVQSAIENIHWPTFYMAVIAFVLLLGLKKYLPKFPNVLVAVVITTLLAALTNYSGIGGQVVGFVPEGLPALVVPSFDKEIILQLGMTALIISLVGFMEAIAVAKAMAARTRQRLDADQELVGQGLSNIVSGFTSGYPVSGSFSRSAVNIDAGAETGFSSIVTGLIVGVSLLFLTPLLFHLPQATLAAVIMLAVAGLVKVRPIIDAWRAEPHDAIVAVVTFVLTLYIAPHIEYGIMVGVMLSLVLFVFRTMRPRVAEVSRFKDGTMRDVIVHPELMLSDKISIIRFDNSIYFANASYFEDKVLEVMAKYPDLKFIILDAQGVNMIDSTGDEILHHVTERLRENGIELLVAHPKKQFMDSLRGTKVLDYLGEEHVFSRMQYALDYAWDSLGDEYDRSNCPLRRR